MRILRSTLFIAFVAYLGAGCDVVRLYGGYGSEDALKVQIVEANERLVASLAQAKAEHELLVSSARGDETLEIMAYLYGEAVERHELVVLQSAEMMEDLIESPARLGFIGDYRALNRGLGSTVALTNRLEDKYEAITRDVYAYVSGEPYAEPLTPRSRYQVTPPYYARLFYEAETLSMREALAG